jgi:hypothetical protein
MASVKLANYKARVVFLHELHTAKVAEYNERLNARIVEYESHWFRKLFRMKFKDSCEWQWDWYCNSATTVYYCEKELPRIEYHEKLGDERIEFNEDYFGLYNFYDWCKEKGLP